MTKEKSRIDDRADVADPETDSPVKNEFTRLIGRLLARTWLERHREAEKGDSSAEEPLQEDSPCPACEDEDAPEDCIRKLEDE